MFRKRKYTIQDIKSRNVIFDSKLNNYNAEGFIYSPISMQNLVNLDSNDSQLNIYNIEDNNNINYNPNISTFQFFNNEEKEKIFPDNSINKNYNNENHKSNIDDKNSILKDEIDLIPENDLSFEILNIDQLISNTENVHFCDSDHKRRLLPILKNILTIDIITNLKILKNDIKEYFDKYSIDIFSNCVNYDFSGINIQEQNIKFCEFIKFGTFNDIYENILSKYLNNFYRSIFRDKDFIGSLEKILVHYFKIHNRLSDSDQLIDFKEIIKIYSQK